MVRIRLKRMGRRNKPSFRLTAVDIPRSRDGKVLEVGVARPRALYVLYPIKGKEILCRGVVLPYYEFAHEVSDLLLELQHQSELEDLEQQLDERRHAAGAPAVE